MMFEKLSCGIPIYSRDQVIVICIAVWNQLSFGVSRTNHWPGRQKASCSSSTIRKLIANKTYVLRHLGVAPGSYYDTLSSLAPFQTLAISRKYFDYIQSTRFSACQILALQLNMIYRTTWGLWRLRTCKSWFSGSRCSTVLLARWAISSLFQRLCMYQKRCNASLPELTKKHHLGRSCLWLL